MNARRAIFLTARREVRERIRTRAFQVSTGIVLLLVAGIVAIAALNDGGPAEVRVVTVGADARAVGEAAREQQEAFGLRVELASAPTEAAARAALRDGETDLALVDGRLLLGANPDEQTVAALQGAARGLQLRERLGEQGLSAGAIERLLDVAPLAVTEVEDSGSSGAGLAWIASLVLYLAIFTAGLAVATGIVEEKSSRVVELVLSAIRPAHLLVGKVVGVGLVALLQLVLVVVVGLGLSLATGGVDLPETTANLTAVVFVCFLLGYALYACAFAAAGSLVSRQEDVQSATAPMMIALVGGYLLSFTAIEDPDSTLATALTFVPPLAPLIVPVRAAQDALSAGELAGSIAAMVAGTLLLVAIGARIYERSVLRIGAPVKLSQALRLPRSR